MFVERVEVRIAGGFYENCYLVSEGKGTSPVTIIDPGSQAEVILKAVGDRVVERIILTHRHYDHTGAVIDLVEATGAEVVAFALEAQAICDNTETGPLSAQARTKRIHVDRTVEEGDTIAVGKSLLEVLHTPGHTEGSMCLYDAKDHILLAGDTLFFEAVGRCDLPTGDEAQMRQSIAKLFLLPDDTVVHPGHDADTTIQHEKRFNVYSSSSE